MRRVIVAFAALLLSAEAARPAEIPACGPYETQAAALRTAAGEVPAARMLSVRGVVLEILASPDGDSWTLLVVGPSGRACIVEMGGAFALLPQGTAS